MLALATVFASAQGTSFQEKAGFDLEAQHFFEQADAFYDAGQMQDAADYYAAAADADPQNARAYYNLALANFNLKNYGKAAVALEKLFQITPDDLEATELYGHTLLSRGQATKAIECFDKVVGAEATDLRYVNRALAKIAIRHTNEALNDFDLALNLNPQNFDACLGKGISLMELGQPSLAAAWLQQALNLRPADATALTNLGVIQFRMGEREAAMQSFRSAIWSDRRSDVFLARAKCYLLDGNFSDAIADAKEAMLLDGENAAVYAFIGEVELAKGSTGDAIESFGIAIDLAPECADHYLGRAGASIQAKRYYDAVADLYRALELEPYNEKARTMLQVAYTQVDMDAQGRSLSRSEH
jgi:tetratricopeptide (TPR) repeat protein